MLARCVLSNAPGTADSVETVLWDIISVPDGKSATISAAIRQLHNRDGVSLSKCLGWTSDRCQAMLTAADNVITDERDGGWLVCYCAAHRLDLAVSTDSWKNSPLCRRIERCLRIAYTIFNRSGQRRRELKALEVAYGRILIPTALQDVRWLSKLNCLQVLVSSKDAIAEYLTSKPNLLRDNADYEFLLETIDDYSEEMMMVVQLLRPCGILTKRLQERKLDLWAALALLDSTIVQLKAIDNLSDEVRGLRLRFAVDCIYTYLHSYV